MEDQEQPDTRAILQTLTTQNMQLMQANPQIDARIVYLLAGVEALKIALSGDDEEGRARLEVVHESVFGAHLSAIVEQGKEPALTVASALVTPAGKTVDLTRSAG